MKSLFQYFKKFNQLSPEAEKAISEISSIVTIKKNKDLQSIGHTCKTIYFINIGVARIYYFKDGIDITEGFFFENNIIARVESLFTGRPSRKAIQILEDAEILAINANQLFKLYDVTFYYSFFCFRVGYSNGVSDISCNSSRKHKSTGQGKKYRHLSSMERFRLCHWSNTYRDNSRLNKHQCFHYLHWSIDIGICFYNSLPDEVQDRRLIKNMRLDNE